MNAWAVPAALGLVAAVAVAQPSTAARRLEVGGRRHRDDTTRRRSAGLGRLATTGGRRAVALCAGGAVAVVLASWWALVVAVLVAAALDHWLAGLPDRAGVAGLAQAQRQLPLALELMAGALSAGAPTVTAVVLAGKGVGPPLSRQLLAVASSLRLGAGADEAWRAARDDPVLRPLARLAVRSAASGAVMAQACRDLAVQQRQVRAAAAEAAIKRAGVLAVLPLALCFLPAFVLVGVVPVVVGLLSSLTL